MKTTLSSKGQIVLPAELRLKDKLKPGSQFEIERVQEGEYVLKRLPSGRSGGVLEWLRSCPSQGWFRRIPSESTDEIRGLE